MIIRRMVINMNETRLETIEQIEPCHSASAPIEFSASGGDSERYAHISPAAFSNDLTTLDVPSVSEAYCIGTCNLPVATAGHRSPVG